MVRATDHVLYVNLYHGIDRLPFTSEELETTRRSSDVLVAMIEQHFALTNDEDAIDLNAVQRLIAEVARERGAPLSIRESDTCARIVAGYSTPCDAQRVVLELATERKRGVRTTLRRRTLL
jgi:hypothetical protein